MKSPHNPNEGSVPRAGRKHEQGRHSYTLPSDSLSTREREVCELLIEGLSLKQAASRLDISIHTADCHTRHAYQKLGVHDRVELVKRFAKPNVKAVRDALTYTTDTALEHLQMSDGRLSDRSRP